VRSPAVRFTGVAIAGVLAYAFGYFAAVLGIAALGDDGTWSDAFGAAACMVLFAGCASLALGGSR
jgi:hypothetical protein